MMGESEANISQSTEAVKVGQDEVLGLKAIFLGVSIMLINMIFDIFAGLNYIELIAGGVVLFFIVLSFIPYVIDKFGSFIAGSENVSNLVNLLTVVSAIYLLADIIMDYYSAEHRIVAIIFSAFCVFLVFYEFVYKRCRYRYGKMTRITIETDKNIDIHITEKQDPDGDDE